MAAVPSILSPTGKFSTKPIVDLREVPIKIGWPNVVNSSSLRRIVRGLARAPDSRIAGAGELARGRITNAAPRHRWSSGHRRRSDPSRVSHYAMSKYQLLNFPFI